MTKAPTRQALCRSLRQRKLPLEEAALHLELLRLRQEPRLKNHVPRGPGLNKVILLPMEAVLEVLLVMTGSYLMVLFLVVRMCCSHRGPNDLPRLPRLRLLAHLRFVPC